MKGGLLFKKQEMTRVWVGDEMTPVTLLKFIPQKVLRRKTQETDGYESVVVGVQPKKKSRITKGKELFARVVEFKDVNNDLFDGDLDVSLLEGVETVCVVGVSKGKGFQGGMKRHNFGGGPATHGSKFHRALGSTGNRKPRRTHKGKKMAGHMGSEVKTLKKVKVVDIYSLDGENILALKGSVPGAYNTYIKVIIN